ncbi:phosphosulfolactate synthase [Pinirhizobacter sp.]|jgi:phosphosulfolactate synthase|uniref:phosphosulfolactate synthase n=1 Tax=Pinirhizobacter sp. TaxID=2950432 RepID=UPI002F4227E2
MTGPALDRLEDKCLSIVRVPARPARPRSEGLTVVADRGLGPRALDDLLDTAGEYIDVAKFAMGVSRLLPEALVRGKIQAYDKRGIPAFFAGEVSELALMQGVAKEYFAAIHDLGGWGVEVSNAQVAMGIGQKSALIALARDAGLEVVAECGRKGGVDWTGSAKLVAAEVKACLDAGAWRVLIQAEGLNEGVEKRNEGLVLDLVGQFGLGQLIFQAKEEGLIPWFLKTFGSAVNLDVDSDQVLDLESQRRGLRKRGVFALMAGH